MSALAPTRAAALLRREVAHNHVARRAVQTLATEGKRISGGVIPIEDALRTYELRLAWARKTGVPIRGASKLIVRLRHSGLKRVAVFSTDADGDRMIFFADPDYETLIASLSLPAETNEGFAAEA